MQIKKLAWEGNSKDVLPGAWELRARDESGQYRAIYVQLVKDRIHVLHCFQKKSQKTSRYDVEKAQARYRALRQQLGS